MWQVADMRDGGIMLERRRMKRIAAKFLPKCFDPL